MRKNLLNWCNLVSINKKLRFYVFGVARIYYYLADLLQKKIIMKNSKLKFSKCMQNISRSKSFGKFLFIAKGNPKVPSKVPSKVPPRCPQSAPKVPPKCSQSAQSTPKSIFVTMYVMHGLFLSISSSF